MANVLKHLGVPKPAQLAKAKLTKVCFGRSRLRWTQREGMSLLEYRTVVTLTDDSVLSKNHAHSLPIPAQLGMMPVGPPQHSIAISLCGHTWLSSQLIHRAW